MSTQDLRFEFVVEASREGANIRRLCRRFGVSAKTGYKWLARFSAAGKSGLADRGRRRLTCPRQSEPETEAAVLTVREAHPAWGGPLLADGGAPTSWSVSATSAGARPVDG